MTAAAHVYEIFIRAPQQRVWEAMTQPDVHHPLLPRHADRVDASSPGRDS